MFQVGEKVVCTFSGWGNRNGVTRFKRPVEGQVYLIAGIAYWRGDHELLILEGFPPENGYSSRHFRKFHDANVESILKELNENPYRIR